MLPVQDEAVRWNARQVFGEETGHPGLGTSAVEFKGGVQLLTADDHQIGQRIVEAIPVLVVNHFAGKKGASQGLLDHETVPSRLSGQSTGESQTGRTCGAFCALSAEQVP